jgi:hypothetical protein
MLSSNSKLQMSCLSVQHMQVDSSHSNGRYNLELRDCNSQSFQMDYFFVLVILRVHTFQLLGKLQAFKTSHSCFVSKQAEFHLYSS